MEVLLDAVFPNLLKDLISGNVPLGNHLLHKKGFCLSEKELPGIIFRQVLPEIIDYVIPPVDGRDLHNLIQCLLDLVVHFTFLFIGLVLIFWQEKPCSQEQLGSQGLVPIVASGPVKILRVDHVHQKKLGKGVIGILYDMLHIGLGHKEPGIVVQVVWNL